MNLRIVCALLLVAAAARGAKPVVLAHDDGTQDSKRSIGGDGQAVRFERPAEEFVLTAVRIYGSRYGGRYDPFFEVAQVSICDTALKPLAKESKSFPISLWLKVDRLWG